MPRHKKQVWNHFKGDYLVNKTRKTRCNYCKCLATAKAERLQKHLSDCASFQKHRTRASIESTCDDDGVSSHEESIDDEQDQSNMVMNTRHSSMNDHVTSISSQKKQRIDNLLSVAIHSSALPFSVFDSAEWDAVFQELNPAYKLPDRRTIGDTLLGQTYETVKAKLVEHLKSWRHVCISIDGMTNITGSQIINIMVCNPISLFIKHVCLGQRRETASELLQTVTMAKEEIKQIISDGRTRERSPAISFAFVSDSPSVMKKLRKEIGKDHDFLFAYGCAPHALNNLALDIINHEKPMDAISTCMQIVKYIRGSPRLLKTFHGCCISAYSKSYSLPLFSKTRWSTATLMLRRIEKVREALEALPYRSPKGFDNNIRLTLNDSSFWKSVQCLLGLLSTISRSLGYLESEEAPLSAVFACFCFIKIQLLELESVASDLELVVAECLARVDHRFTTIFSPFHALAFHTDPYYIKFRQELVKIKTISLDFGCGPYQQSYQAGMRALANKYPDISDNLMNEFADFESHVQEGTLPFQECFNLHPSKWWALASADFPALSLRMKYLHQNPVGAAGGERNHKVAKSVHSKLRSRLSDEKVEKQVFIAYNLSQLKRVHERKIIQRKYSHISCIMASSIFKNVSSASRANVQVRNNIEQSEQSQAEDAQMGSDDESSDDDLDEWVTNGDIDAAIRQAVDFAVQLDSMESEN